MRSHCSVHAVHWRRGLFLYYQSKVPGLVGWPDIKVVKDKQYSDLVVTLGMNHSKIVGENQRAAMRELEGYFISP